MIDLCVSAVMGWILTRTFNSGQNVQAGVRNEQGAVANSLFGCIAIVVNLVPNAGGDSRRRRLAEGEAGGSSGRGAQRGLDTEERDTYHNPRTHGRSNPRRLLGTCLSADLRHGQAQSVDK